MLIFSHFSITYFSYSFVFYLSTKLCSLIDILNIRFNFFHKGQYDLTCTMTLIYQFCITLLNFYCLPHLSQAPLLLVTFLSIQTDCIGSSTLIFHDVHSPLIFKACDILVYEFAKIKSLLCQVHFWVLFVAPVLLFSSFKILV